MRRLLIRQLLSLNEVPYVHVKTGEVVVANVVEASNVALYR